MAVRLLEEHVVNQIAAGEVVERPASVVKELVENALDAGARTVEIWLRNGGINRIRVVDDGSGMDRHDALLSIERHATSKLRTAEDLVGVATLGFRGEALPSIASVSRFELITRPAAADVGTKIRMDAGKLVDVADTGCPAGTEVDVRALFGAVPARRKFLRSPATELEHCLEAVVRVALIRPDVEFRVHADDRVALDLRRGEPAERIRSALGDDAANLLAMSAEESAVHVEALVAPPGVHRAAAAGGLYLYAGGRFVRDVVLRRAVLDAWRDLLPRGRYPVGVVQVAVPAGDVDVNVHPSKVEVRFRDPAAVSGAVVAALRSGVAAVGIRPVEPVRSVAAARADRDAPDVLPLPGLVSPPPRPPTGIPAHPDDDLRWKFPAPEPAPWLRDEPAVVASPTAELRPPVSTVATVGAWRGARPVGTVGDRWLAVERGGTLVILDRQAIDEHRLRRALVAGSAPHALVAPVRVPVGEARADRLVAAADTLSRWGFSLDRFGPREVVAVAVPAPAVRVDVGALLREIPLEAPLIPPWLASRAASPGAPLTPYEQRALLVELDDLGLDDSTASPAIAVGIDLSALFRP